MARPAGVPFVVTWHNAVLASGLRGAVHRMLERRVARLADVTLGASTDLVARALAAGGRDVRPGAVAAPGLPPPSPPAAQGRDALGGAEGQPPLLAVGRVPPQKGYDRL